jgi:hypothetical protein
MTEFYKCAIGHNITHNDLHLGNVLCHDDNYKVIDFGRAYIKTKSDQKTSIPSRFAINVESYGVLYDLGTFCLNFLQYTPYCWPDFCQFEIFDDDANDGANININLDFVDTCNGVTNLTIFDVGVLWIACCVQTYLQMYKNIDPTDKDISIKSLHKTLQNERPLLWAANMFNPDVVNNKVFHETVLNLWKIKMGKMGLNINNIEILSGGTVSRKKRAKSKMTPDVLTAGGPDEYLNVGVYHYHIQQEAKKGEERTIPRYKKVRGISEIKKALDKQHVVPDKGVNEYLYEDLVHKIESIVQFNSYSDEQIVPSFSSAPLTDGVTAYGGSQYPCRKVFIAKASGRKFAMIKKTKWYLDENRGRYVYTNPEKTHIYIRSKAL